MQAVGWLEGWVMFQSTGRLKWHKKPTLQPMEFTAGGPSPLVPNPSDV